MIGDLNHVTLPVRDLEAGLEFYREVLGFRPLARWSRGAYFLAGRATWLCLALDSEATPGAGHVAFSVGSSDFTRSRQRILESGAREWRENTSEGESVYFEDPDGNRLELHVGDWKTRLSSCREAPYEGMVFFEDDERR